MLTMDRIVDIQFNQLIRNPTRLRISRRKGQATKSNTLAMSALKSRQNNLLTWSNIAEA
jgi:hypothetical protein